MNPARVKPDHIRRARLCMKGARAWAERYGFDWPQLLAEGWDADAMEATGCHLALQVVKLAREDADDGRG